MNACKMNEVYFSIIFKTLKMTS